MNLFDNALARLGYVKAKTISAPEWALATADRSRFSIPDGHLPQTQSELYQRLSWVQTAIDFIAGAAASVPLGIQSVQGEEAQDINNHPFEQLMLRPNPLLSRSEFLFSTFAYRKLTGNAYWWINAPGPDAPPTELWIVPPHKIQPVPDGKLYLKGYLYRDGDYEKLLPVDEVVHFKQFHPLNPFVGLSPIEALATIAVGDMKMQEWNTNHFGKNHAKPAGALLFGEHIPDPYWNEFKDEVTAKHGGTQRNMLMLRGVGKDGVSWLQMALSQKDMEFLAGRQMNREEIFQLYGIPMGMLSENATEANATTAEATFAKYKLWPQLVSVAETITNNLLPRYGADLVAAFDDVRIADQQLELAQRQTWATYWKIDELRAADGKDPMGDERGEKLSVEIAMSPAPVVVPPPEGPVSAPPELAKLEAAPPEPSREQEEFPVKAIYADDLALWKKKALRLIHEKGIAVCPFDSERVPAHARNHIAAGLARAENGEAVKAVFAEAFAIARGAAPEDAGDAAKRVEADLRRWQSKALAAVVEGKPHKMADFTSHIIPPGLLDAIKGALEEVTTLDAVKAVFADALEWSAYP